MKSVYCCGIGCIVNLMRSLYWKFEYIFSLRFCLCLRISQFFCLIRWGCVRSSEKQGADVLYIGIWCINSVYTSILCGAEEWMYAHHLMLLSDSMRLGEKFVETRCTRPFSAIRYILNVYTSVHFYLRWVDACPGCLYILFAVIPVYMLYIHHCLHPTRNRANIHASIFS